METLRQIMRRFKIPVIVVSAHSTTGASATFKALSLGAFDFVAKPRDAASAHMEDISAQLIAKINAAASSHARLMAPAYEPARVLKPSGGRKNLPATKVVVIGISTGGPNALQYLLAHLPPDFPGAIVAVQHMPEGFTDMFARRLNDCCAVDVKEAQSGDMLVAGRVLICPGNKHIRVKRMALGDVAVLNDEDRVNGHRPSVDVLFRSAAEQFGVHSIGVLMTGMGEDGAEGLGAMKDAGALTIAQDEQSCVVFGMPKAAIERGFAQRVVSLEMMANTLVAQCAAEQHRMAAKA